MLFPETAGNKYAVVEPFRESVNLPKVIVPVYRQIEFDQAPWHIASIFDDIDDSLYTWNYLYNNVLNRNLPVREVKVKDKSLPWINSSIRKQMNLRYKLLKKCQGVRRRSSKVVTIQE